MRQVNLKSPGGVDMLTIGSAPMPEPGPSEVRIRVAAAGVNRADIAQRQGRYPPPAGASPVLGLEVCGHVDAVGSDVRTLQPGAAVCSLTAGGGYAEYVCVPASHCLPVPRGYTLEQAAALPEVAMTVWSNLMGHGRLQAGERVLIHGGTSGIGAFAISLLTARGHPTIATAGSRDKCDAVQSWGAAAVNYRDTDFVDAVLAWSDKQGVDVVLDMVGGSYVNRNLRCLARGGRVVQIAFLQGQTAELDLIEIARREAILTGSLLRPRTVDDKARIVDALRQEVWPMLDDRRMDLPVIDGIYPMDAVADAHTRMESGAHIGKLVLRWAAA
ncbi:MAG: NAD(P)H-quinone oxidoreductase [Burkholderiaceae bacterium]